VRRRPRRAGACGFTLVELLVAMFIAAIMFALGYSAINQALNSRGSVREHQDSLMQLLTTVRTLEQDLVQLAPRPVRSPVGYTYQPALIGSFSGQPVLTLTRGGWNNPSGLQRPGLQRVAYYLEKGTLRREYFNVLDPTQTTQPVKRDILTHVKAFTVRYMDASQNWQTQWPPLMVSGPQGSNLRQRPIAVEITLDTEEWGKIVRLVEIAG
jgi:general secretion pathway protein J